MKWHFHSCELKRVIDGDTVEVKVDMGFNVFLDVTIRLARIDAPEPRGDTKLAGLLATTFAKELFETHGGNFSMDTVKHGKYRWVAELNFPDGTNFSDSMVKYGFAVLKNF